MLLIKCIEQARYLDSVRGSQDKFQDKGAKAGAPGRNCLRRGTWCHRRGEEAMWFPNIS